MGYPVSSAKPGQLGSGLGRLRPHKHKDARFIGASFLVYFQICPYPYSPSSKLPSAKRSKRNDVISTVFGFPSSINSTKLAPAAGEVLNPVPLRPQAR